MFISFAFDSTVGNFFPWFIPLQIFTRLFSKTMDKKFWKASFIFSQRHWLHEEFDLLLPSIMSFFINKPPDSFSFRKYLKFFEIFPHLLYLSISYRFPSHYFTSWYVSVSLLKKNLWRKIHINLAEDFCCKKKNLTKLREKKSYDYSIFIRVFCYSLYSFPPPQERQPLVSVSLENNEKKCSVGDRERWRGRNLINRAEGIKEVFVCEFLDKRIMRELFLRLSRISVTKTVFDVVNLMCRIKKEWHRYRHEFKEKIS